MSRRILRCEKCGEPIGEVLVEEAGRPEDNPNIVLRCYRCAAVEEAEAILDREGEK